MLEHVIDTALTGEIAALPDGMGIEITNRATILAPDARLVRIPWEDGILSLPSCQFQLIPFKEIVERYLPSIETFELFLTSENIPSFSFRWNLSAWGSVNAALITHYRAWLKQYVVESEHSMKLEAITIYCQLSEMQGYLSPERVEEIRTAIEQEQPWRTSRSRSKKVLPRS